MIDSRKGDTIREQTGRAKLLFLQSRITCTFLRSPALFSEAVLNTIPPLNSADSTVPKGRLLYPPVIARSEAKRISDMASQTSHEELLVWVEPIPGETAKTKIFENICSRHHQLRVNFLSVPEGGHLDEGEYRFLCKYDPVIVSVTVLGALAQMSFSTQL